MSDRKHDACLEEVERLASHIMHIYYCENDAQKVAGLLGPDVTWFGAGEEQYAFGGKETAQAFLSFTGKIPKCIIEDEEYYTKELEPGLYLAAGRMWIYTDPSVKMILKVHQRITFLFREIGGELRCIHIHCSNPYQELMQGEAFPDKIGRQSYEYMQERIHELEERETQQKRQMDVILASIPGGLKISNDDETYSYAYVSEEAAALFGYTLEEFLAATGGNAVGAVYPPDLPGALGDCARAFRNGGLSYSTKYRVCCKNGSLKWIIDSGKKALNSEGKWVVNSLYLDISRAEQDSLMIREQSELLQSIYDTVPCGIIRFVRKKDGSCELVSLNKGIVKLMDYDSIEQAMEDWHDGVMGTVQQKDRQTIYGIYALLKEPGDSQENEYRVCWRDKTTHWMSGSTIVVGMTEDGLPVIQHTVTDITQSKELQLKLDQEQELYRAAVESNSDIMYEYFMNTDTFVIHEMSPGEGMRLIEIAHFTDRIKMKQTIHPDDVQLVMDNICKGRAEMFEMRVLVEDKNGPHYEWNRVTGTLIIEGKKASRVVGTIRSIQGMKDSLAANDELLHMNQSALQAISNVYVGIFYIDMPHDHFYGVRLPETHKEICFPRSGSFSKELGNILKMLVDKEDICKIDHMFDIEWLKQKLSGRNELIETEFCRAKGRNGRQTWIQFGIHMVSETDGMPKTAIFTCRNITGEREQELERRKEEEKAKQALEEAYEAVNSANLAKSDFLSKVSHDIRTPMNAILGMTTIAEHNLDSRENVEDCLRKIHTAGKHLLGLINEVLDMSKIESGNMMLFEEEFCLTDTLDQVVEMIGQEVENRHQQLLVESDGILHDAVCGDAMRIQQILLNLLSNAVKYTPDRGCIRIAVKEKLHTKGGIGCFEFVVEDNGIGMSPEFQKKLFDPFERAEDSRVSKTQGTGLGMAITWNLVQMLNGSIEVTSQLEQGTRFNVLVYLKISHRKNAEESRKHENEIEDKIECLPNIHILLVEDNEINREITQKILHMYGVKVTCAVNGKEALDLFSDDPPGTYHLILMDVQMPVMDGYAATRAIRGLADCKGRPDAADIPIIALTANAFVDDICRSRQAGMNDHVTKPLDVKHLIQVIHSWILQ